MDPESKRRFRFVEEAVDDILHPLGFAKKKAIWRRNIKEVLQQFSIVSKQLNEEYRPEWGLNIIARCEDPAPLPWKLSVRWVLEMTVKNLEERLEYLKCFEFGLDLPDAWRRERVQRLLKEYVIPCFDAIQTEESVRAMMGDRNFPLRAQSYVRLPDEWWPLDIQRARAKDNRESRRIIRRWNPKTGAMDEFPI